MFTLINVAQAGTAAGVETAMNAIVAMILALAGIGIVGIIAWRGVQFAAARDYSHISEALVGLGVGGGMIGFARPLGALLVGGAAATSFTPILHAPLNDGISDLIAIALYHAPMITLGMVWWKRHGR